MLSLGSNTRIFLYAQVADMRKGFAGLSGIVRQELEADPTDGSLLTLNACPLMASFQN
jgi:hypothetical protein